MSRSRRKPVYGENYMETVCCTGDKASGKWKRSYNRNMRRTKRHQVRVLENISPEDLDDDETQFIDDPEFTSNGNSWELGDGKYPMELINRKPYQRSMK